MPFISIDELGAFLACNLKKSEDCEPMKHIYVFRLSIFSIIAIAFSGLNYSHIYYYTDTSFCRKIVKVMLYLRNLRSEPMRAEFNVGSIRDEVVFVK